MTDENLIAGSGVFAAMTLMRQSPSGRIAFPRSFYEKLDPLMGAIVDAGFVVRRGGYGYPGYQITELGRAEYDAIVAELVS